MGVGWVRCVSVTASLGKGGEFKNRRLGCPTAWTARGHGPDRLEPAHPAHGACHSGQIGPGKIRGSGGTTVRAEKVSKGVFQDRPVDSAPGENLQCKAHEIYSAECRGEGGERHPHLPPPPLPSRSGRQLCVPERPIGSALRVRPIRVTRRLHPSRAACARRVPERPAGSALAPSESQRSRASESQCRRACTHKHARPARRYSASELSESRSQTTHGSDGAAPRLHPRLAAAPSDSHRSELSLSAARGSSAHAERARTLTRARTRAHARTHAHTNGPPLPLCRESARSARTHPHVCTRAHARAFRASARARGDGRSCASAGRRVK